MQEVWPLFGLVIDTQLVSMRVPREAEITELSQLAAEGVHRPAERPFLTPWAEGSPEERTRTVLQDHWSRLGSWSVDRWRLGLGVFVRGVPIGMVVLRAEHFPVVREVSTSSWLGLAHHGKGFGTAARAGLLAFAFDHLFAEAAVTNVFQDNHASQGVSRKLGYRPDGISRDRRGKEVVVSDRMRLSREDWIRTDVAITGLTPCRPMFGI